MHGAINRSGGLANHLDDCCGAQINKMSTAQFDTGVTEFVAKLRAFIRARVPDDVTADDLTQETLLKVYRSRASLRDDDRLEAWLYRIARRTLIDYYRKRCPSEELPASLKSESEDEVGAIRDAVLVSTIRFMEELPDPYRVPLQLSELEGMPMAQIAHRLGLSLTAVKSRIRRGRQMLKRKLQDCCHFEFDQHGKVIGWERRNPRCCD
jgi:RNA polymerase sigma-70 factor (ECF subfamily)